MYVDDESLSNQCTVGFTCNDFNDEAAVRVQNAATHLFSVDVKNQIYASAKNKDRRNIWLTHPDGSCVAATTFLNMVQ